MKKLISGLMALTLCLALAACGSRQENLKETEDMQTSAAAETAEMSETAAEAPKTVEITMDNWSEYFELREAAEPWFSEDGSIESWDFSYGVFLKDTYLERFQSGQVDFEIGFEKELREIGMEAETGTYMIGNPLETGEERPYEQKTCGMEDFRNREDLSVKSEFYGSVAAQAYSGSSGKNEEGILTAELPVNGQILNAEGSLILK